MNSVVDFMKIRRREETVVPTREWVRRTTTGVWQQRHAWSELRNVSVSSLLDQTRKWILSLQKMNYVNKTLFLMLFAIVVKIYVKIVWLLHTNLQMYEKYQFLSKLTCDMFQLTYLNLRRCNFTCRAIISLRVKTRFLYT